MYSIQKETVLELLKSDEAAHQNRYWITYKDFFNSADPFTDFACENLSGKKKYLRLKIQLTVIILFSIAGGIEIQLCFGSSPNHRFLKVIWRGICGSLCMGITHDTDGWVFEWLISDYRYENNNSLSESPLHLLLRPIFRRLHANLINVRSTSKIHFVYLT